VPYRHQATRTYQLKRSIDGKTVVIHFIASVPLQALVYIEREPNGEVLDVWAGKYQTILEIWEDIDFKTGRPYADQRFYP